jgi:hypothetical protein
MALCLGKLAQHPEQSRALPEIVESNGAPDAVGRPPLAIASLLVRPEARLPHLPD